MGLTDDVKKLEEITAKAKNLKIQYRIYNCLICLGSIGAAMLIYTGGIGAYIGLGIFLPLFIGSLALWIYTKSQLEKYQKVGMDLLWKIRAGSVEETRERLEFITSDDNGSVVRSEKSTTFQPQAEGEKENGECVICNEPISISKEEIFKCPKCKFLAHKSHFQIWLKKHDTCPNCGVKLP